MIYTYKIILDIFETSRTENGYVHFEDGRKRITTENHFNYVTTVPVTREELLDCLKGTKGIVNITGEFKDDIYKEIRKEEEKMWYNGKTLEEVIIKKDISDTDIQAGIPPSSIIELMKPYQDEISANKLKIESAMLKNSIINKDGMTYKVLVMVDSKDIPEGIDILKLSQIESYNLIKERNIPFKIELKKLPIENFKEDNDDFHPDNSI